MHFIYPRLGGKKMSTVRAVVCFITIQAPFHHFLLVLTNTDLQNMGVGFSVGLCFAHFINYFLQQYENIGAYSTTCLW